MALRRATKENKKPGPTFRSYSQFQTYTPRAAVKFTLGKAAITPGVGTIRWQFQ
jgi:hypothetical protein